MYSISVFRVQHNYTDDKIRQPVIEMVKIQTQYNTHIAYLFLHKIS